MGDDALRFEVLGPVRAFRGDTPVDVGPRNQQAVLGLLLLRAGQAVSVTEIIGVLWGNDPPENGEDIVLRYIGALRRILDPYRTSLIAFTHGGYVLRTPPEAVDTGAFRSAVDRARDEHRTGSLGEATGEVRQALNRWREEPLTGLTGPVFDAARARLSAERATAAELLTPPPGLAGARAQVAVPAAAPTPVFPAPTPADSAPAPVFPAPTPADSAPAPVFPAPTPVFPVPAPVPVPAPGPAAAVPAPDPAAAAVPVRPTTAEPA
ncbi:MAG TPA: BTAD domain-containing putative transcriptional regulator, partial [Actinoplanes sp.]|nr:BTAD domain-containing putative transcriptional regulator [Actinoplanes sp.]